jgi:hypothetical protein
MPVAQTPHAAVAIAPSARTALTPHRQGTQAVFIECNSCVWMQLFKFQNSRYWFREMGNSSEWLSGQAFFPRGATSALS